MNHNRLISLNFFSGQALNTECNLDVREVVYLILFRCILNSGCRILDTILLNDDRYQSRRKGRVSDLIQKLCEDRSRRRDPFRAAVHRLQFNIFGPLPAKADVGRPGQARTTGSFRPSFSLASALMRNLRAVKSNCLIDQSVVRIDFRCEHRIDQ